MLEQQCAVAHLADQFGGMAGDDERANSLVECIYPPLGARCKSGIARSDRLIKQENVGVDRRRHRECQAHQHAGGVGANGQIQKLAKLAEGGNFIDFPANISPAHSQQESDVEDVFVASVILIEADHWIEEGGYLALRPDRALRRLIDAAEQSQQRRLAV